MRGRRLYQAVAEASAANATQFLKDARSLRRRGSIGHACSLAVLAVEEGAKAIVYKEAAEGMVRFVTKKPNNVSTYKEKDLAFHEFKHGTIGRLLIGVLEFSPFHQALASTRRKTFTREDVASVLRDAHLRQTFQRTELQRGGRVKRDLDQTFATLSRLNDLKKVGFYVEKGGTDPVRPDAAVRGELERVFELAELAAKAAAETVTQEFTTRQRRELTAHLQELAAMSRRLQRLAPKTAGTGESKPRAVATAPSR